MDLPALEGLHPTINPAEKFQTAQTNAVNNQSEVMRQQAAMMEILANGAAYAMPDGPSGQPDPVKWDKVKTSLKAMGFAPDMIDKVGDPALVPALLHGSAAALSAAHDPQLFQLKTQQMQADLDKARADLARIPAPVTDSRYDETTGTDQKIQWNSKDGVWEPLGGPKKPADKSGRDTPETWFGNVVYMKDPNSGKVIAGQASSWGRFKQMEGAQGFEPAIPVQQLNTGNEFAGVDRFGNPTGITTPIDNRTPAFESAAGKGAGEREAAKPETQATDTAALSGFRRQVGVVSDNVDQAIAQIDANPTLNTGFLGDLAAVVKGSPPYDLAQTLLTIKANVGFSQLQQMRDNSKTGGALGNVSDKETELLQAVDAALAQGQSAPQLKANLRKVKELQAEVAAEKQAAYDKKYGGTVADDDLNSGATLPDPLGARR